MRIIRAGDYVTRPWKNGGGTTREIVTFPDASGYVAFDWLISAAHVGQDGPFSIFPNVDRSMAILSGTAMALHGLGAGPVILTPHSAPYAFPGDVPVTATLADGPVEDLNLMTRRGRFQHSMRRLQLTGSADLAPRGRLVIFAERGPVHVNSDEAIKRANEGDTIICDGRVVISGDPGSRALLMDIWPV
jgi:uncharacterized protein